MEALFLKILNMSLTASYVILAILLARLLLKKAPKKYSYALWVVAAFRLVCPVSFASVFSLLRPLGVPVQDHAMTYVPQTIGYETQPAVNLGVPAVSQAVSQSLPAAAPAASVNPMQIWVFAGTVLWCLGMAAILIYGIISYVNLKRRLRTAVRLEDNVYQSETVRSPFILDFVKPRIYVPYGLDEAAMGYVLAHERYHLKRCDHLVKPLAYLILTVHWFNPLVWLAFRLMGRDMEMRCDEKVLAGEENIGKAYSMTLLSFAANRRFPAPAPLAFGESGVKIRIKNALRWKKPKLWMSVLAVVFCAAVAAACAANPAGEAQITLPEQPPAELPEEASELEPQTAIPPIDDPWGLELTAQVQTMNSLTLTARQSGGQVTGELMLTDYMFDMEQWVNGEWISLTKLLGAGVYSGDPVVISAGTETSCEINWQWLYGELEPGRYRMTFVVSDVRDAKRFDGDHRQYRVEFSLTEDTPAALTGELGDPDGAALSAEAESLEAAVSQAILQENGGAYLPRGTYAFESHVVLSHLVACGGTTAETQDDSKAVVGYDTLYMMVLYQEFKVVNNRLVDLGGNHNAVAITVNTHQDGTFTVQEYWTPGDGAYWLEDVQAKFPKDTHSQVNTQLWIEAQKQNVYAQAVNMGVVEPNGAVSALLDAILTDPNESHTMEERELRYYGDYTLQYIAREFFRGDQTGERADLMLRMMSELMAEEGPPYDDGDPQAVFDDWANNAQALMESVDEEFMELNYPKTLLVMQQKP